MRQTHKPRGKRSHTPVWEVIWSVRPRLKDLVPKLASLPVAPATAGAAPAVPVQEAPASRSAPAAGNQPDHSASWWVKQIGRDMAIVPLKLLHILLAGYEPQARRPQIRYRRST